MKYELPESPLQIGVTCSVGDRVYTADQMQAAYQAGRDSAKVGQSEPSKDVRTWCEYIAGMICTYLNEPIDSPKVAAIAGIIERRMWSLPTPHPEFLRLAESCGAKLTGKPDGSEPITVVFTIDAWRAFDAAIAASNKKAGL